MKKCKLIFVILLFGIMLIPGTVLVIKKDRTFSDLENRNLSVRPSFNISEILSGKTESDLTDFVTDQFPLRDFLMRLSTEYKKGLLMKDVGGVYFGKNGFVLDKLYDGKVDTENYKKNLDKLAEFINDYKELNPTFALVPSPSSVLSDYLPAFAENYDDTAMYDMAASIIGDNFLNMRERYVSLHEKEVSENVIDTLYFKTDHHYTSYGAYVAYSEYCKTNGIVPKDISYFNIKVLSDKFYGTMYSKAADFATEPDVISIPSIDEDNIYVSGGTDKIYDYEALNRKDKYTVYFGGNYGVVEIKTSVNNGKRLLIIKDSYANSLVPYLTAEYEYIVMVDPRFYTGSIGQVIDNGQVNEILVFYEMSNFINDSEMRRMMIFK
ncbi:MAG: hypothetical protein IJK13_06280 [Lachnospiraceae bacterium]|nr:hypothetical protein [Lachnospiraceae bacterium]